MTNDNPKGSVWHRWEPHIHVPGTVLNDQFPKSDDRFELYCDQIENSSPKIRALGVTDYYTLSSYEQIIQLKKQGRLNDVELIFPNVEVRLKLGTSNDKFVNGHLLFSPEDPDHVLEIKRFLSKLTFKTRKDVYACTDADLKKLGKDHDPNIIADHKLMEAGANQFKVDFEQLITNINGSTWAQENLLIAVAAGEDGTSGLQSSDSSYDEIRKKIEHDAHIIFSSSEKDRSFWIGKGGKLSKEDIVKVYRCCKPCIHGSDAHDLSKVGKPKNEKFTWVKGDLTFESIRQVCIEPEDRVIVSSQPMTSVTEAYVIDQIEITNADWMNPQNLPLNSGLVTIIGARGSGKTALADLIATGGYAISQQMGDTSFIRRAFYHLQDTSVKLEWLSGNHTEQQIIDTENEDLISNPRVQYLSQKFVDQLCSAEGVTDKLLKEIERVIFNSHQPEEKLGLSGFKDLLDKKAESARADRAEHETMIAQTSELITRERFKKNNIAILNTKKQELEGNINRDKGARAKLLSKDKDSRLQSLADATAALDSVSVKLDAVQTKLRSINALQQAVSTARSTTFPPFYNRLKDANESAGLSELEWSAFQVDFKGNVIDILSAHTISLNVEIGKIKGTKAEISNPQNLNISFITPGNPLVNHTFEILSQEVDRLQKLIGIDTQNATLYTKISERILKTEGELEKLKVEIIDANGAQQRIENHILVRKNAYREVFNALLLEEQELRDLYKPLVENLKTQSGSLGKLSFTVKRTADIEVWADRGESLLDLRKMGAFRGKGALLDFVKKELKPIWESGNADEISNALAKFRDDHEAHLIEHAQAERTDKAGFSKWANQIAEWLYSTDHISINYGVIYDDVDISQLSPGTRGIVLLLLYLAIDKEDDRPLIIDQPEENLDPKSIFDELVPLFKTAKNRRQIIIVTHNANLVVNTDADQVIIAKAGAHSIGQLPKMYYSMGGLENQLIRKGVCEILEGGEQAFKERAKRLRVAI